MAKPGSLWIAERFCGPPGVGNGGYVSGLLAKHLQSVVGPCAPLVRLHAPVPLATVLEIVCMADSSLQLRHKDQLLATCQPGNLQLQTPDSPDYAQATALAEKCHGLHYHPFPECFVCGPQRVPGDGLRIFPGRLQPAGTNVNSNSDHQFHNLVAAPWLPDESLASSSAANTTLQAAACQQSVAAEFIWAALDCTGSFPIDFGADKVLVLGQFQVRLLRPVSIGEHCVVMGWLKQAEGRKYFTETLLCNSKKELCGLGQAVWIQIPG